MTEPLPDRPSVIGSIISLLQPSRKSHDRSEKITTLEQEQITPFPQIPEVIIHVLSYIPLEPGDYLNFGLVSVNFYLAAHTYFDLSKVSFKNYNNDWHLEHLSLQLWKNMVLEEWPNFGSFCFQFTNY
jgi:hypothetical protein